MSKILCKVNINKYLDWVNVKVDETNNTSYASYYCFIIKRLLHNPYEYLVKSFLESDLAQESGWEEASDKDKFLYLLGNYNE